MNIIDMLYNHGTSPVEGSYIFFDGTNWVHGKMPEGVRLCEDVRLCLFLAGITELFEIDNISLEFNNNGEISVITDFINEIINVSYNSGNLIIGSTSIDINNIIDSPLITFRDQRSNYFNLVGRNTIHVEGIDGLTTVTDNGNIYLLLPNPADIYFSDHMNDGPHPQLPGDYLPFNHRLVLTWDGVNHRSFWDVDQCCPHVLDFDKGLLTADGGESYIDLTSINTDNQELGLDDNILSLTRWHGGTNGQQVQDPDSVVDLIDVNEHTLQLDTHRYISIMGSDGIINHTEDLFMVGPKSLGFNKTTNELILKNDEGTIVSAEDISGVNKQLLNWHDGFLWLSGKVVSQIGFRKPVQICPEAMACVCNNKLTTAQRYSRGLLQPSQRDMGDRWEARNLPQPTDRPEDMKIIMNKPGGFSICDMADVVFRAVGMPSTYRKYVYVNINIDVDIYFDYYYSHYHNEVVNDYRNTFNIDRRRYYDYRSYDNRTYDNSRVYNDYRTYVTLTGGGGIYTNITQIQKVISRSKYRGRIYATENRVMWSKNDGNSGGIKARRYFPNFDGGEGWSATGGTLTPYNNMLFADNFIVPYLDRLKLSDGRERQLANPSGYSVSKSINNPNESASGKCSELGSKTITIPYDGNYLVSLNAEVQVDHNVLAFRVSVLKMSLTQSGGLGAPQPIVDTKFGGGNNVGSSSLNNVVYPITKEYTCSGSKIVSLKKGDVLAVGVRIDPSTLRPKTHPQNWLNQQTGYDSVKGFSWINFGAGNHGYVSCPYGGHLVGDHPPSLVQKYPRPIPNGSGNIYPTSRSTYSIGEAGVGRESYYSLRPTPAVPDIGNRYYFSPTGGQNGAQNYGYMLHRGFPEDSPFEFWDDDGCVVLLGPSNVMEPTGGQTFPVIDEGGSMLTVVYQNKDYLEIIP